MFIIINCSVDKSRTGLDQFGTAPNEKSNNLTLDNVVLCKADTNNAGHPDWVDKIAHNRRISITINEDDFALRHSGIKPGNAQRARLGHYINLHRHVLGAELSFAARRSGGEERKAEDLLPGSIHRPAGRTAVAVLCGGDLV